MVSAPAVSVRGLTVAYGARAVLEGISFDVPSGRIFGILGGSGSGKTSLLRCMIGLVKPAAGDILLADESIVTAEGETRQRLLRTFGMSFQGGALL